MPQRVSLPLNRSLLRPGERVCVAVSGGADSTALLLALHQQAASLAVGISAAHLHHGIRGAEADADLEFVQELCKRLDVELHVERADVPSAATSGGETLEEAARNARLSFFDRLLQAGEAGIVATAHTEDDQAETVLMKLMRGGWTEGLGGISPILKRPAGSIVRPLLAATRRQTVEFLQAKKQGWRDDSTNQSLAHTRNRVRTILLPVLREFNPSITSTLSSTAQIARDEEAHWQPEIARLLTQLALPGKPVRGGGRAVGTAPGGGSVAFEMERLRSLDVATRRRLLRAAAARLGTRLSFADIQRTLQMCGLQSPDHPVDPTVPSKPNSRLDLQGGMRVERSLRELRLSRA